MTRATAHTPTHAHATATIAAERSSDALTRVVVLLCHATPARCGALLRPEALGRDGAYTVIAAAGSPTGETGVWLNEPSVLAVVREAHATRRVVRERCANEAARHVVALPILAEQGRGGVGAVRAVAVFLLDDADDAELSARAARLRLCADLVRAAESDAASAEAQRATARAHAALSVLCAVNEHERFFAAAVRLCNELAARFACARVSHGEARDGGVRLLAISHTERFTRSAALAHAIERAMDECVDQGEPVRFPASPDDETISRDHATLARDHAARAALSVPVHRRDDVAAAVTLEREHDAPWTDDEVETISAIVALCGPRLLELRAHDRWFGVRLARDVRAALAWVVGPHHTWAKVGALAALVFLAFATLTTAPDRVVASMTIQAAARHDVAAPFAGRVARTHVEIGAPVVAGQTVLCELDTTDLRLELAETRSELTAYEKDAAAHMRDGSAAEGQIALASAQRVAARIALLQERLSRANVVAAIDGVVVASALERRALAPVGAGETLFEIASIDALHAELFIADVHVSRVRVGMNGEVAAASRPGDRTRIVVERIDPAARVVDGRNVYRVEARIVDAPSWMCPGLTGEARVDVGRARRAERWTRSFVDWARLRLWL